MATTPVKVWTKLIGTSSNQWLNVQGLTTGSDGSIYATGSTHGNLDGETSNGGADAFLIKYDANGNRAWTQLWGTSVGDAGWGLTTGSDGSIYVSGYTLGYLDGETNSGVRLQMV